MPSSDFPTYGRGDDPAEPEPLSQYGGYAKPSAYGPGGYSGPQDSRGPQQANQPQYGQHPQQQHPQQQYGQPPYGQPQYGQPPYGAPGHPHQPPYGADPAGPRQRTERDPRIATLVLITTIVTAVYGLLVISIQRSALRDIAQAPGSPLNHPLRTDVIDTLGQISVPILGGFSIGFWLRDLMIRRRAGRPPDPVELGGLGLIGIALVPLLVWFLMVLSTGMGAIDETLDRLPTAYGWGGAGLLMLAGGFAIGYRAIRPEAPRSIVRPPPQRPPWA